jgi:hypothetical protein
MILIRSEKDATTFPFLSGDLRPAHPKLTPDNAFALTLQSFVFNSWVIH